MERLVACNPLRHWTGQANKNMSKRIIWKTIVGLGILSAVLFYCVQSNVRLFFVVTGSMGAAIPSKSIIISKIIRTDEIKAGAVIIFNDESNKRVAAHRVVEIREGRYVTKGDANDNKDRCLVKSEDVIGRVVGIFPIVDPLYFGAQLIFLVLMLVLGVLTKRFLLCLKHDISCPTTAYNAFYKICVFGRAKKVDCGGQTPFSPG